MFNSRQILPALAAVSIVTVALTNLLDLTQRVPPAALEISGAVASSDPAMRQERRLAKLRESAKAHGISGAVGYLDDAPVGSPVDAPPRVQEYYLAQFALVPLVLDRVAAAHPWAIANFFTARRAIAVPPSWQVVEDFGDGVLLLHQSNQ
jgi:hypothetical protein